MCEIAHCYVLTFIFTPIFNVACCPDKIADSLAQIADFHGKFKRKIIDLRFICDFEAKTNAEILNDAAVFADPRETQGTFSGFFRDSFWS